MDHFFDKLPGENWFDYSGLYSSMVKKFNDGSHFVEVGTWKGMSACYMAVEIINSNKKIKFDCVDTWDYVPTSAEISAEQCNGLYEMFLKNIEPVKEYITPVRALSWDGAKNYEDNSLDFIFIDAGHDYESVTKDLNAWFPRLKKTGVIAGHDYHYNVGVYPAVNEFFSERQLPVNTAGACWIVNLNNE